jgi:iron complex transport system ATP-binding protein
MRQAPTLPVAPPRPHGPTAVPPLWEARAAALTLRRGPAFGSFDLSLAAGERVAVLGPSGAGKSTLLRLAAGDHAATRGQVCIDGRPLAEWPPLALAQRRAVLPQSHAVAFAMPVRLVVGLGRLARSEIDGDPQQPGIVNQALEAAQAQHLAPRRFDTLSGGEQARVMLARVFAQLWDAEAGLLLVDEPLTALDPALQLELTAALLDFCASRRHALLAVLHDINLALASFDRLWLVREGKLLGDLPGRREAVPQLEALYGIGLLCMEAGDGRWAVLPQPAARAALRTPVEPAARSPA